MGVAVGDVNGDGRVDLALTHDRGLPLRVFLQQGDGGWTPAVTGLPAPREALFWGVELADLNGDGHLDLVAVEHRKRGVRLWLGDGAGGWQACPVTGLPDDPSILRGWGLAVADVDGDGRLDLAAGFGRKQVGSLEVWLQTAPPPADPGVESNR